MFILQPYNGPASDATVEKNETIEQLDQAKRTNKELYLFAVNKLLNCNWYWRIHVICKFAIFASYILVYPCLI